jgi:hypothetical protein
MKKFLVSIIFSLAGTLAAFSQGIPVMDVTHIAMTVANGTTLNDQLKKMEEQLVVSYHIAGKVSDIYQLQQDYQDHLQQASSVENLQWSDLTGSQQQAMSLATDMDAYVPAYENIDQLKAAYESLEGLSGSLALYQELEGFGADTRLPRNIRGLQMMLENLSVNRAAFDEMAYKKKLQVALSYNQVADDLLAKAQELSQALLVNERFSMTEGERLSGIKQAHDYILKSMDLKLASDQLILDVMKAAETSKSGVVQNYQQQLIRREVATTSVY